MSITSTPTEDVGGMSRREAVRLWTDLAESETRMNLLRILIKEGMGLPELEEFNLGLASKFNLLNLRKCLIDSQEWKEKSFCRP